MDDLWRVLALISMPAAGSLVGGLLAEMLQISRRTLSLALHGVAGMLLGVVGIELMPRALEAELPWLIILLFGAGGVFTIGLDWLTHFVQEIAPGGSERSPVRNDSDGGGAEDESTAEGEDAGSGSSQSGDDGRRAGAGAAWVIFLGVAIDFLTDGLMLVTGSALEQGLGLLLGLALLAADTPEAFATVATMKRSGSSRRTRLLLTFSFPVILYAGAAAGHFVLRGASPLVQLGVLAFTAGVILTLVIEEVIPQSHEKWEGSLATLILIGGFMLFAFLSEYAG